MDLRQRKWIELRFAIHTHATGVDDEIQILPDVRLQRRDGQLVDADGGGDVRRYQRAARSHVDRAAATPVERERDIHRRVRLCGKSFHVQMQRLHAKLCDVRCRMIFHSSGKSADVEFSEIKSPRSGSFRRGVGSGSRNRVIGLRNQIFQSRERTVGFATDECRTTIERYQSHASHAPGQSSAGVGDDELAHAEQRGV